MVDTQASSTDRTNHESEGIPCVIIVSSARGAIRAATPCTW